MGRKRNPYIQLFTRDILSSPRCRALSEPAAGVYFLLLCRLNEPPTPGAYRISDWEMHPTWKRSKTQQCLATADKYERLQYFAAMLAKNDLPWKQSSILSGLQELYKYGIIIVEGDMLIQPRMYKDNRFDLPDLDNDGDPVNTILDDPAEGSMVPDGDEELSENKEYLKSTEKSTHKGTKKEPRKVLVSHAPATRALSVEPMRNKNNKGSSSGSSTSSSGTGKTKSNTEAESAAAPATRRPVADNPPTLSDIQAYFDERAAQGKAFELISAEEFLDICEVGGWTIRNGQPILDWKAYLRQCEIWRQRHGDVPKGQPPAAKAGEAVPATPPAKGKYKKW